MSLILAIESSCDDTAASVIKNGKILTNFVSSQKIHEIYGGVVPELASRSHQKNIIHVVNLALSEAKIQKKSLNAIAFTVGPGLLGSLLVATSFAKGLSLSLNKPLIAVDHLHAHILSNFIDKPKPDFPFLCLLVSGGHTMIIKMNSPLEFEVLGKTLDDAAGEAFDKAAKLMGLAYPGGPLIDKFAQKGNPTRFKFPMPKVNGLDYSFSGLKTSLLYFLKDALKKDENFIKNNLADICASYQYSIVKYLLLQFRAAASKSGIKHLGMAGGVAANSLLRQEFKHLSNELKAQSFIPDMAYCIDNAAMIAITAHYKYEAGIFASGDILPYARSPLKF